MVHELKFCGIIVNLFLKSHKRAVNVDCVVVSRFKVTVCYAYISLAAAYVQQVGKRGHNVVFVGNEIDFVKCEVFAHLRQPAEARHIVDCDVFALYVFAFAKENSAGVSVCVCCERNCVAEFVFSLSFV